MNLQRRMTEEDDKAKALNIAKKAVPEAIEALKQIFNDESIEPHIRIRAARLLRQFIKDNESGEGNG